MTCNIASTPYHPEPLPLYRRDPETVSILSSAPSYHSDAPTYTSRRTSGVQQPALLPSLGSSNRTAYGLPNLRYAPGYESRAHGSMSDLQGHNYNIGNWSNINSSHASRQYRNVASRRVAAASSTTTLVNVASQPTGTTSISNTGNNSGGSGGGGLGGGGGGGAVGAGAGGSGLTVNPTGPASRSYVAVNNTIIEAATPFASTSNLPLPTNDLTAHPSSTTTTTATTTNADGENPPANPHEDPALVGEIAAARARDQRLYREMALRDDAQALRAEGRAWDFMFLQMAEWEERQASWRGFRSNMNSRIGGGGGGALSNVAGRVKIGLGLGGGRKLLKRGKLMG